MLKQGDKVKIRSIFGLDSRHKIGECGEIHDINLNKKQYHYGVKFNDGDIQFYNEDELRKIDNLNVYIAAPFFSDIQIDRVKLVENALYKNDTIESFFSPMQNQECEYEMFTPKWAKEIMENDIKHVDEADIVVAIVDMDGQDTDSGTAMEIGYAIANNKPVYLINFEKMVVNLMLTERIVAFFDDIEKLEKYDFVKAEKIPYNGEYR